MGKYTYNVNKNSIEYDGKFVAYLNVIDAGKIVNLLNQQDKQDENVVDEFVDYLIFDEFLDFLKKKKRGEEK